MDPATIGLLISIAPTVLDLLFGRGHHIKDQALIQSLKTMYGYGLEGYGYAGEGFRYPPIEGYYDQPVTIATVQKEGPRKGMEIKRYLPKVDDRWVAAYLLNKRIAAKNMWRKYATEVLQEASQKYLEDLKKESPESYARAIEQKGKRAARKGRIPIPLRSAEGQRLLDELQKLKDEELLAHYYHGRKPGKIPKKIRTKYPTLLEMTRELAKKIKSVGQEVLPTQPVQKTGIMERHIWRFKKPLTPTLITVEEEFEPVEFTEKDYEEAVQRLKQHYPKIGRRVYKTPTKSWKQVYDDMLAIIEKEKWTPKSKTKTNR